MTTVGYGDITPKTPEGKAITIAVMLVGIGFAALVIGAIAHRFIAPAAKANELGPDLSRRLPAAFGGDVTLC